MTKTIEEKVTKLPAWVCVQDEAQKSAANIELFTDEQIDTTRLIADRAEAIYDCKGVYVNWRKKFSVIKLDRVYGDPNVKAAIALKEFAESHGFEKVYIKSSHSIKFTAKRVEKKACNAV